MAVFGPAEVVLCVFFVFFVLRGGISGGCHVHLDLLLVALELEN